VFRPATVTHHHGSALRSSNSARVSASLQLGRSVHPFAASSMPLSSASDGSISATPRLRGPSAPRQPAPRAPISAADSQRVIVLSAALHDLVSVRHGAANHPEWSESPAWRGERRALPSRAMRARAPVPEIHSLAEHSSQQNQRVRHHEHPTSQEPTVSDEANRRGALAEEEPLRDALRGTVSPLRINLPTKRPEENGGGCPADQFSHRVEPAVRAAVGSPLSCTCKAASTAPLRCMAGLLCSAADDDFA